MRGSPRFQSSKMPAAINLGAADAALDEAKRRGRDRVCIREAGAAPSQDRIPVAIPR